MPVRTAGRGHPAATRGTAVNDVRARRTAVLAAAARAKSEAKAAAAGQAIRRLVKKGEPVTFQPVQREAGVSHAFLYGNADLRARIERLRDQARPKPPPPDSTGGDNTIIQALTSQITHLKNRPFPIAFGGPGAITVAITRQSHARR